MPVFRLEIPLLGSVPALRFFGLRGRSEESGASRPRRHSGDPLPPVLVVEGEPNPSLRRVIDEAAAELGVSVCTVDTLEGLDDDPDFESVTWSGLFAPAGTPKTIVDLINRKINGILAGASLEEAFTSRGIEVGGGSPELFGAKTQSEIRKWTDFVRARNIRIDK